MYFLYSGLFHECFNLIFHAYIACIKQIGFARGPDDHPVGVSVWESKADGPLLFPCEGFVL